MKFYNALELIFNSVNFFRAFGLIPTKHIANIGEILKVVCDNGFDINNCAMYQLTREQSTELTQILGFGINDIWSTGPSFAMALTGIDAFNRFKQLVAGKKNSPYLIQLKKIS